MARLAITVAGPLILLGSALLTSVLALLLTGGDSFFAGRSAWIYAPWLLALGLTLPAWAATLFLPEGVAAGLVAAATLAYAATVVLWLIVLPARG